MSSGPRFPSFESLAIVGVGLIGGSIAAAVKLRGIAKSVIGVGRSRERLEAARRAGILDHTATGFDQLDAADLVVVCTPVDRIAEDVRRAAALGAGTLITDVGSVKSCIQDELRATLPEAVTFVGSHPLAGSEKTGWEHGRANLFVDRLCVITPEEDSPQEAVGRIVQFWEALGMRTQRMSAQQHDRAVAATSHVPHLAAAALMALLNDANEALTATGFRDTTRIAAADPGLWTAIFRGNEPAVLEEIDQLVEHLAAYRQALATGDNKALRRMLTAAKQRRDSLDS